MFQTKHLQDDQAYLVADYDPFFLTLGILRFHKRKPHLEHCVRSFFGENEREFHPDIFERNFSQLCHELHKKVGELPKEVCIFLDNGESVMTSTGYTFSRDYPDTPIELDEVNYFAQHLLSQSEHQAQKVWNEESGYMPHERKLVSVFLSYLALDNKHHTFPVGKKASHATMRCLFFYGKQGLLEGLSNSIRMAGYEMIACVPLPLVFLNHICNKKTFLDSHLHIHLGYDSTTVVLHLGKHVQEIQTVPFGWKMLDDDLQPLYSPLERESFLMGGNIKQIIELPQVTRYQEFLLASLRVLFERFGLQWSFTEYSISSTGPTNIVSAVIKKGQLSPWIQKNASCDVLSVDPTDHWLRYCDTLDPLFSLYPHPLLSLVRSVFIPPHAHH